MFVCLGLIAFAGCEKKEDKKEEEPAPVVIAPGGGVASFQLPYCFKQQ